MEINQSKTTWKFNLEKNKNKGVSIFAHSISTLGKTLGMGS